MSLIDNRHFYDALLKTISEWILNKWLHHILCLSWSLRLQCGDTNLLRVWKLHRCLALRPVGRHGVQLSASQSHLPGTVIAEHIVFSVFWHVSLDIHFFSFVPIFPSDVVPGHKQWAQQASWFHCGYQDTQPAGWQWSWHVPHHWNTGGCQQQSTYIIYAAQIIIY